MMTFRSGARVQFRPNLGPPQIFFAYFYKDNMIFLGPETYINWYS